jgi:hypothetical protein
LTGDPLHGHQDGRFFHGYYDRHGYLPLYVFCGRHLLAAKLRPSNIDGSAGWSRRWRGSSVRYGRAGQGRASCAPIPGFAREAQTAWCEENRVEFVFGLARNARLVEEIAVELLQAEAETSSTGKPARRYKDFRYATLDSWSRRRRVVAKAEWNQGEANPRFIVSSLSRAETNGPFLYEKVYCARGDMENRIKECQGDLFADRTSTATMRAGPSAQWKEYAAARESQPCTRKNQGRRPCQPISLAQSNGLNRFGQIRQARGFRQFLMRGVERVAGEWPRMSRPQRLEARPGAEPFYRRNRSHVTPRRLHQRTTFASAPRHAQIVHPEIKLTALSLFRTCVNENREPGQNARPENPFARTNEVRAHGCRHDWAARQWFRAAGNDRHAKGLTAPPNEGAQIRYLTAPPQGRVGAA